jgi:arginyl-tRNA synthetase
MLAFYGNTAPYIQYDYARIQSILKKTTSLLSSPSANIILETGYELALAKHVLRFGEVLELVAKELKPHYLSNYLYDLAVKFSSFYENCDVLKSAEPIRFSRLVLCHVVAGTLRKGLDLLGIQVAAQM